MFGAATLDVGIAECPSGTSFRLILNTIAHIKRDTISNVRVVDRGSTPKTGSGRIAHIVTALRLLAGRNVDTLLLRKIAAFSSALIQTKGEEQKEKRFHFEKKQMKNERIFCLKYLGHLRVNLDSFSTKNSKKH